MRVFVDTSAWFALANAADRRHADVRAALQAHRGRLVTSNFIFDELVTLCRMRVGHSAALKAGQLLHDVRLTEMLRVAPEDDREAWSLFANRPDQNYSFTDCTSFVLMRRLKVEHAIALDDDFKREGFQVVP